MVDNGGERTTLSIKKETFERLVRLFQPRETWDGFLNRVADIIEETAA